MRYVEVATRIKRARRAKGLSQEQLAELVGTSRRHVIRWEKGQNRPRREYSQKLAAVLDLDEEVAA